MNDLISVYDSKQCGSLSSSLEVQLALIYKLKIEPSEDDDDEKTLHLECPGVQQQTGGSDCGVFAIAFAYHAANGDDLCTMQFEQKKMRQHLAECFQNQKFQPFPHSVSPKRIMGKYFPGKVIEVYCDCELPESYQSKQCNLLKKVSVQWNRGWNAIGTDLNVSFDYSQQLFREGAISTTEQKLNNVLNASLLVVFLGDMLKL